MSDPITPAAPAAPVASVTPAENGGEGAGFTPPASQEELNRIIADRVSRERAKYSDYDDLKAARDQLAAIEEANKTEAQKQAEALAEATAKLATYEQREQVAAWSAEIVKDSHVPVSLLRGETQEELQAHFEALKAAIPAPSVAPVPPAVPGFVGQQPAGNGNVPLKDQIAAAEKAGNWDLATQLKAIQLGQSA